LGKKKKKKKRREKRKENRKIEKIEKKVIQTFHLCAALRASVIQGEKE